MLLRAIARQIFYEQSPTRKENLCDIERTAAFVSFGMAISEIDFRSGFLVPACGYSAGELGRIACAGGGKFVSHGAGGDSVARTERPRGAGDQCAAQRGGPKTTGVCQVRQAGAGSIFQPAL